MLAVINVSSNRVADIPYIIIISFCLKDMGINSFENDNLQNMQSISRQSDTQ